MKTQIATEIIKALRQVHHGIHMDLKAESSILEIEVPTDLNGSWIVRLCTGQIISAVSEGMVSVVEAAEIIEAEAFISLRLAGCHPDYFSRHLHNGANHSWFDLSPHAFFKNT